MVTSQNEKYQSFTIFSLKTNYTKSL